MKLLIIFALIVASCTTQPVSQEISAEEAMANMPCHQMPDGSWMGECDTQKDTDVELAPLAQSSREVRPIGVFKLDARPVTFSIGDATVNGYGYNGEIPGPIFMVDKDDKVTVDFKNNLDEPTTVHWHGLRHDIKDDGVPGVSQDPVLPGETYTYNLYFPDEGIYWYHPHIREDRQQDLGLAGLMRVGTSRYEEEYIVLDDLFIESGLNFNYGAEDANFAIMGRYGTKLLINGKDKIERSMKTGEIRRFFFTNVANARPFRIRFDDAAMKAVGGDIGWYQEEKMVDHVILAPAQRVAVDVQYLKEGKYDIIHESSEEEYILGTVSVTAGEGTDDFSLRTNEDIKDDIESFKEFYDKEPDYTLTLDVDLDMGDMPCHQMGGQWMGDCSPEQLAQNVEEEEHHEDGIEWEDDMPMMNLMSTTEMVEWKIVDQDGRENMDIGMKAKVGDTIKIRLINTEESDHPMQHPIHLHGQRFLVTSIDGEEPELIGWEDTVLVPAGSTADILVDVTNPGEWMMHCHIAEHLEAGMMTSLIVEE